MKVDKINNSPNFNARIQITKRNLDKLENKLSDICTDTGLLGTTASSIAGGSASQVSAMGPSLHISAQTPELASVPQIAEQSMPHSAWDFVKQFIKPTMGIKEDASVSSYSSVLGSFLQRFGSSGYDFCKFGESGSRKFPS